MKSPSSKQILSEVEVVEKLQAIGEERLLDHWESLKNPEKMRLKEQLTKLDIIFFLRQQEELANPQEKTHSFTSFQPSFSSGNFEHFEKGRSLLSEGKGACVILAGGQGSRFGCLGPKGCVPITSIKNKTLFQLLAEKIRAASILVNYPLQVAIMTSPLNHATTVDYFTKNAFFGLDPSQVTFFSQKMWPFLDGKGHLFLQAPDRVANGPNGNGGVFRCLVEGGVWKKWKESGVEIVNILPVDNPLALPFDQEIFGFQKHLCCEAVIKVAKRLNPEEKAGLLVNIEGKLQIIEYSELTENQKENIVDPTVNLGLYSFSMSFIKRAADCILPLHRAEKIAKRWLKSGEIKEKIWKFEEFIFDVLPLANRCEAILYPREYTFAPLKNLEGADSIASVQAALFAYNRAIYSSVTGSEVSKEAQFELASSFYYPTEALLKKWKHKPLPDQAYIKE